MDYEKKYNEAIKYLKAFVDGDCVTESEILADFPELKDSEDERIRKEIIEHIKDQINSFIAPPDCRDKYDEEELARYESWIAYLEKQKEPKPTWSEEDDKIMQTMIKEGDLKPSEIAWLKSLRPSWKPSEEQMKAFRGYIEDFQGRANAAVGGWNNFDVMIRLYEQLKKL